MGGRSAMKYTFLRFLIYECPAMPTERGRYIGQTPIEEQAINAVENHNKNRDVNTPAWFIYGITPSGEKIIFL